MRWDVHYKPADAVQESGQWGVESSWSNELPYYGCERVSEVQDSGREVESFPIGF